MFQALGNWVHWALTGEEDGGPPESTEGTDPPKRRGLWGIVRNVVRTAVWVVQELASLVNAVVEVVVLGRAVGSAAASLLTPTPVKVSCRGIR